MAVGKCKSGRIGKNRSIGRIREQKRINTKSARIRRFAMTPLVSNRVVYALISTPVRCKQCRSAFRDSVRHIVDPRVQFGFKLG